MMPRNFKEALILLYAILILPISFPLCCLIALREATQ